MGILDAIFPKKCFGCGNLGGYFCEKCVSGLERRRLICPMCTRESVGGWVHGRCRTARGMDRLIAPFRYAGAFQFALKRVKYSSSWEVLQAMFDVFFAEAEDFFSDYEGVVVGVPMYSQKERSRGFNQAEMLGRMLAHRLGVKYLPVLIRTRKTKSQYGLSKKERGENIRGAFQLSGDVKDKKVLLVDDVWTSGATIRECGKVLKRGGAKEVWGVCLGR